MVKSEKLSSNKYFNIKSKIIPYGFSGFLFIFVVYITISVYIIIILNIYFRSIGCDIYN